MQEPKPTMSHFPLHSLASGSAQNYVSLNGPTVRHQNYSSSIKYLVNCVNGPGPFSLALRYTPLKAQSAAMAMWVEARVTEEALLPGVGVVAAMGMALVLTTWSG